MKMPIEVLYVILALIVLTAVLGFMILPKMFRLKEEIDETKEELELVLKERWTLIPKFIELAKPHFRDNRTALEELIKIRNTTFENMDFRKKVSVDSSIGSVVSNLFEMLDKSVLEENAEFKKIEEKLDQVETEIEGIKKKYNLFVSDLNKAIRKFPKNIFAKLANVKSEEML